jgi:hypothetical protein
VKVNLAFDDISSATANCVQIFVMQQSLNNTGDMSLESGAFSESAVDEHF